MSDHDSSSGFGWFLAGLGIGALVGVLYAPKSGKDTRDDLVAGALDAKDRANELYGKGVDAAGDYIQQGRETVGTYVDKGREYYDKGRTQWTEYVDKGKGLIHEQAEKVSAAVDAGKEAYVNTTVNDAPQG